MNTYEFTFLMEDDKETSKLEKVLETAKGKKLDERAWGQRLLAYPINKKTSAYYFTWFIHMEPLNIADFKKKLQYDKIAIRYLLVETDYTQKNQKQKVKKVEAKKD